MEYRSLLNYCLEKMNHSGADKSEVTLEISEKHELNTEANIVKLLRTTEDLKLSLVYIKDQRKATTSINRATQSAIDEAIKKLVKLAASAPIDEANDIAEGGEPQKFHIGVDRMDLDSFYSSVEEFTNDMREKYPKVLGEMIISFDYREKYLLNSNGVDLEESRGNYYIEVIFAAKDGGKLSSINYTYGTTDELNSRLTTLFMLDDMMDQSTKELDPKPLEGKFVGDIIITPICLVDEFFLDCLSETLTDSAIIGGYSVLKDSIGKEIAAPIFNFYSNPRDRSLASGYAITEDGYVAEDLTIVKDGVLQTHLLSQYGAKKLGRERSKNCGGAFVIDSGSATLDEMIKGVERGILLCRFSGPEPSSDGSFSGIAKNSFYIEDGKIQYAISDTMVSGNIFELLRSIKSISDKRVNFGSSILPWIHSTGITISGK